MRYRIWLAPMLFLAGVLLTSPVYAHFKLNLNIRIIHVEHVSDGLDVYMRLPMPYLVANLLGPEKADGSRDPAPYTFNAIVDGELMHYVDSSAYTSNADGLGQLVADGHSFSQNGRSLIASINGVRLATGDTQQPFSTLEEAKAVFAASVIPLMDPPPFVGDTVVDVHLRYWIGKPIKTYSISSVLNPGLAGQEDTANLILDHYGEDQSRMVCVIF